MKNNPYNFLSKFSNITSKFKLQTEFAIETPNKVTNHENGGNRTYKGALQ